MLENPFLQFDEWFKTAKEQCIKDYNACCLATADANGFPNARMVLLKEVNEYGFIFYTNYKSVKAQEISHNPNCCMVFHWADLGRQIRIKGVAKKISREKSLSYFQSRTKESQIISSLSSQSQIMESDTDFEYQILKLTAENASTPHMPLPDSWGGYILTPSQFEFWQEDKTFSQRCQYNLLTMNWHIVQLYP